ncbi:P-loop containing nucleoside triphosphate hydrolase protein [Tribonema minus]|uniref:P-loop containing nucleoside triphosphate hydrolase protein n=1 Tax=Tribonema minus TaxID=303371 RepID=A0A836CA10_9STRA|nr:P-loop containing nucleoside triphosphate hydrolase protein [Tribonema minus]
MMEVDDDTAAKPAVAPAVHTKPWVEKYRPRTVDDIAYQDEVVKTLKKAISTGVMPHLLFYGPPGTGKTSTILAVARTLFGPEMYRTRILELNASDERGIKVVREKVKNFAQAAVGTANATSTTHSCPPFKLIILDEADTMTPDAQAALRRTMETYTKVTRFCLICNYVTRIIEPLASRCAKFRFRALSNETMLTRLDHIAAAEHVSISAAGKQAVIGLAGGDMRKAVTTLQSAHQLYGGSGTEITAEALAEVSGRVSPALVEQIWLAVRSGDFRTLTDAVDAFMFEGSPLSSLLTTLLEDTLADDAIPDVTKAAICKKISEADYSLLLGANEELQLLDVGGFMMRELQRGGRGA